MRLLKALKKVLAAEHYYSLFSGLPKILQGHTFHFPDSFELISQGGETLEIFDGLVFKAENGNPIFKVRNDKLVDFLVKNKDDVYLLIDDEKHKLLKAKVFKPYVYLATKGDFDFKRIAY